MKARELETGSYWQDLKKSGKPLTRLVRHAARVAMPFYRPHKWRVNASRLMWLLRPYSVSIVLLEKPVRKASRKREREELQARA